LKNNIGDVAMKELAYVLVDGSEPTPVKCIVKLLEYFGVSWRTLSLAEYFSREAGSADNRSNIRLFCSWNNFSKIVEECDRRSTSYRDWKEHVHSAFVYGANSYEHRREQSKNLDRETVIRFEHATREWSVSNAFPEFCGAMSGMRVSNDGETPQDIPDAESLTALDRGFTKGKLHLVPVFILSSTEIVDVDTVLKEGNFDVRKHFLSATPIVMFVKWAFPIASWMSHEIGACLVIDDPLLRPQYGFIKYVELLDLMEQHNFSTNIAFIPWNWRRNRPEVLNLFKSHPDRLSISIHGCDHTKGEFGVEEISLLVSKAQESIKRMALLESRSGVSHDRVMVFPQGVFSVAAMEALKRTQFTASVNTEVLSKDLQRPQITTADVWDMAIMKYGHFPLFTRRYPHQGIENFAFDILLGKPCIIVVHHDAFRDQGVELMAFIDALNKLNCKLVWTSLGEVVRMSYRVREVVPGLLDVEMYGSELRLSNSSQKRTRYRISRREKDCVAVKEVFAGTQCLTWTSGDGRIHFELDLEPNEAIRIIIKFQDYSCKRAHGLGVTYKVKALLRRYLSEVRDNYVATYRRK
jgi:hypothetical protein